MPLNPTQKKHYCHSATLAGELKVGPHIVVTPDGVWWRDSGRQIMVDDGMPNDGQFYFEDSEEAVRVIKLRASQKEHETVARARHAYEAFEQIIAGPVHDSNLISKTERDRLQGHGLIDKGYGWNFLTAKGVEVAVALGLLRA